MQLSRLIARLTADERSALLERRLGPKAVGIDDRMLVDRLAQPASIREALADLNNGQLLLLRWLVTRPNLTASWTELLDALGDRLAPGLRDDYLRELRLFGLADYDPKADGGYFATYPAVATVLSTTRGAKLSDHLTRMNSDDLARMAGALGLRRPPTRKDDRIELLLSTLTDTRSLRAIVDALSPEGRKLFEWVRDRGGRVSNQQMYQHAPAPKGSTRSTYGSMTSLWHPDRMGAPSDPLVEVLRRGLVVALSSYPGTWYSPTGFAIADEVELAYTGRSLFDSGDLQPPPMQQAETVDGVIPNPGNLLRDVAHLLGFIGAGRCDWRQDGGPYKRSLVAFDKLLQRFDTAYAETLWELALAGGLLRPARGGTLGFVPVAIGTQSPRELLERLVLAWVQPGTIVDFAGSPYSVQLARLRLLELLQNMPTDVWVLKSSLEAWLRFMWPAIFAPEPQPFLTSPADPGWASIGELLLAHGSTADGQEAVMLPAAHQALLTPGSALEEGVLPPWDDGWIVQPDRSIVTPPNAHPDAQVDLWQVAQLESSQGASVFRVTAESIAAALNRGMKPDAIRKLFRTHSRVPLPPTVERLIDDQAKRYGRVKVGTAQTYVQVDDPALLEELRRHSKLKKLEWRDMAPGVAFVVSTDPGTVLTTLRQAGYLPVLEEPTGSRRDTSSKGRVRERDETLRTIRLAIRDDLTLATTWIDRGRPCSAELEPIDLHGRELHALNLDSVDDEELMIPLDAILALSIGEPIDDDFDVQFDDFDDDDFDDEES